MWGYLYEDFFSWNIFWCNLPTAMFGKCRKEVQPIFVIALCDYKCRPAIWTNKALAFASILEVSTDLVVILINR